MSTSSTEPKHGDKVDDVSEAFSRRGRSSGLLTTLAAPHTASASVYGATTKPVPAWMRKKQVDKYDKYGPKTAVVPPEAAAAAGIAVTAPESTLIDSLDSADTDDRYSKYVSRDAPSRDARLRRSQDVRKREREEDERGYEKRRNVEQDDAYVASYTAAVTADLPTQPQYRQFRSHIDNRQAKDINAVVRAHYNQKTYHLRSLGLRTKLPIYKLRNFNNTIKYILLGNFFGLRGPHAGPKVILDLCCGKGGDLNKFEFVGVDKLIGIDISDASVKEAFKRYSQNKARFIPQGGAAAAAARQRDAKKYNFDACFATGDCFLATVPEILEPNFPGIVAELFPVDCVLIQFALHYAFETEDKVRMLLTNVLKSLRPGGTFIGTIPLLDFIRDKIVKGEVHDRRFGNDLYLVTFHEPPPPDGVFRPAFGNGYNFSLTDAIDDVPEYVVPFEVLRLMCEDYGLVLKYKKNFVDLFNQEIPKYFGRLNKNLIEGMRRSDGKYGAEGSEKEAVAFYLGFVFEKVGG